jgi:hypothetical protein
METSYELWDIGTGNIIGSFTSLDEGLDIVRHLIDSFGRGYAQELDLSRREGDEPGVTVAAGDQLIEMLDRRAVKQTVGQ